MQVSSTTAATAAANTQGVQGSSRQALGKDDFLKLLITQMRYQDPLSPMDNTQFLAQMAQFSSLEQMQNLNESFDQSMLLSQSLNNSSAAGFIGRHVRASGDGVTLGPSGSVELGYFLPVEGRHGQRDGPGRDGPRGAHADGRRHGPGGAPAELGRGRRGRPPGGRRGLHLQGLGQGRRRNRHQRDFRRHGTGGRDHLQERQRLPVGGRS